MEVSGDLDAPAVLILRKASSKKWLGGRQRRSGHSEKIEKSLTPSGNRISPVQLIGRHYTNLAIQAEN
jgi:hypothetical protein